MGTVLSIITILLAISIFAKGYLHFYIADKNDIEMGGAGGLPIYTLWYFSKPVSEEYESLKKLCNRWQLINNWIFLIVIVVSFFSLRAG